MKKSIILLLFIVPGWLYSQQIADENYNPPIDHPEYESGIGPVIYIDEGHYNFHTKEGRYKAFANLLERDGYQVKAYEGIFDKKHLAEGKILVISNALNKKNERNWYLPVPSAFTKAEIEEVRQWVFEGGSLFLIADHMPMAGAAKELAAAFEFEFTNGFAMDTLNRGPAFFNRKEETLIDNVVTNGRDSTERVDQIATFTGQAFRIPADAEPILVFNDRYVNLLPDTAWVFNSNTPIYNIKGWSQGAFKQYGRGRIAVFGEAAMFSAQLVGEQQIKAGMNSEDGKENYKLLLNIIHWLDRKLD